MRSRNNSYGFTLIELVVTVAIVAIVSTLAIPAFQTLIMNNRITSQANQLSSMLAYARSEGAKRPAGFMTLCPTSDSVSCSGNDAWEGGWLVLVDQNGDRIVNGADEVRQVSDRLAGGNTLRVRGLTNSSYVQFDTRGQPLTSALNDFTALTFTICDSRGASDARAVIVAVSGQTRLAQDEDADGILNDHDGNNIICP